MALPDLVAEVRRVLGVDVEARAGMPVAAGWSGTEQLDAFVDVVADYAGRPGATIGGLLAYFDAATERENGLAPADLAVSTERVQILTVHAAKGLEWQVVAVPHLSGRVFPSTAQARTWLTDPADLPPLLRGDRATTTDHGVPVLDTSDVNDRKSLSDRINDHKRRLEQRRIDEERRLLYVALTRAEDTLLLSGHHWGGTEGKPRARRSSWRSSRTSSTAPSRTANRVEWSSSGRRHPLTARRTCCATTSKRCSGPPTRPAIDAPTSIAARNWSPRRWPARR